MHRGCQLNDRTLVRRLGATGLLVTVKDFDRGVASDDVMGQVWVPFGSLLFKSPTRALHGWVPIQPPPGAHLRDSERF